MFSAHRFAAIAGGTQKWAQSDRPDQTARKMGKNAKKKSSTIE